MNSIKQKRLFVFVLLIMLIIFLLVILPKEVFAIKKDVDFGMEAFAVDYDPNEGMIKYGHSGKIGMRPENDIDNNYLNNKKVVYFPSDVANIKDDNGNLLFSDYDVTNPYYDYSDMLNKALEIARKKDNADVFVEPGVYYFTKSIYLFGYTNINAIAGKTAFIIKPNFKGTDGNLVEKNGFFTNKDLSNTYSWYFAGIRDIVFAIEGTHTAFKPTNTVENIISNLCDDKIQATDNFSLFYRIRIKYGCIDNIGLAGFYSFMNWSYVDMLTRVKNITIGPTKLVYNGVETNDAFFYDNYYYGGYYTDADELSQLPIFQINFSMGTTMFTNSYIGNYFFSRSGAGCWCPHTSYSNITFERVYNFVMDTTVDSSSSVSGCLFKDCAYNDIALYFEKQGLEPYNHNTRYWDSEQKKWMFPGSGYIIVDNITTNKREAANHFAGQSISLIVLHKGISFTQNKIECDSLEWTTLVRLTDSEWASRYDARRGAMNITFTDNAFKINKWVKEDLFIDDWRGGKPLSEGWHDNTVIEWGERGWNNDDGTPAMGWIGVDSGKPVSWLVDHIYVSPYYGRYLDFTAFKSKDVPTIGYSKLGKVGADEDLFWNKGLYDQYYYDMNNVNIEKVYLAKDFNAMSWNPSSNHEQLQKAFDYVATNNAILYIEEGTYHIDKPIVLRGGATYKVVFNGTIRTNKTSDMDAAGAFVMSAHDNEPINGYFIDTDLYLQNCNTSGFFNVNTDNFYINVRSIQRGVGCFTNCKLNNTVIHEGQIQYCDYGFFYKTVTNNTLVSNVYGTGSTWVETEDGISQGDKNYRYFISSSDFANSTLRGCWLEFGQFSNGKTLTGAGNSIYRGNLIDYTYNYSFGKNDVVCGNTLTRASYENITNHMLNSNFPIDLPDIITNKPMIMFHVSDGLRLVGNMDIGTMSEKTHFIEFDSPSISYKDRSGNVVKSISNARVVGNGATTTYYGEYKTKRPYIPHGKTENIVFENCKNNTIDLLQFYFIDQVDDVETEEDETFIIPKDEIISQSIPKTRFYINGEFIVIDYPNKQEKELTQIKIPQPEQEKIFDVPNAWETDVKNTQYLLYDFKDKSEEELAELEKIFDSYIDETTTAIYLGSSYNVAIMPGETEPRTLEFKEFMQLSDDGRNSVMKQLLHHEVTTSPSGEKAYYTDQSREGINGSGITNSNGNYNRPTFAIVFDDEKITSTALQGVTTSLYSNMRYGYAWQGKRQVVFILSEDNSNYYGLILGYGEGDYGLFTAPCTVAKNYMKTGDFKRFCEVHYQTGVSQGKINCLSQYDPYGKITRPYKGEQSKTVFGDYTTEPMFNGILEDYQSVILGVDFVCEYNDSYDSVNAYATIDFTNIGIDKSCSPELKATTRKIFLGTYPLEGRSKIFGIWGGDETWIESVQFEYIPEKYSQCVHEFISEVTREGHCTKEKIMRHTCKKCEYVYESRSQADGHKFVDHVRNSDGMTIRKCTICNFKYATTQIPESICEHNYKKNILQNATCDSKGVSVYECTICEDTYTENMEMLEHEYKTTVIDPTTTEKGYTIYTCKNCNNSYKDNYIDAIGNKGDIEENIPPKQEESNDTENTDKPDIENKPTVPEIEDKPNVENKPTVPEIEDNPNVENKPTVPEIKDKLDIENKPTVPEIKDKLDIENKPTVPEIEDKPTVENKPTAPEIEVKLENVIKENTINEIDNSAELILENNTTNGDLKFIIVIIIIFIIIFIGLIIFLIFKNNYK